jgi:transcription factor TFIIIB component B''
VQFKLVNGEMQIDTESLAIRRSALAPLITENMEIVEETSMSRIVNSQSYGKKSRSQRWAKAETEQFYNVSIQSCLLLMSLVD